MSRDMEEWLCAQSPFHSDHTHSEMTFNLWCALFRMNGCSNIFLKIVVFLRAAWLPILVVVLLTFSAVDLVPRVAESDCEMTWMYNWPQYQRVNLPLHLRRSFPQYSLHYYLETRYKEEESQLDDQPLKLTGLPVLFIPGNAGSHKQVRSSASIALQMHRYEFPRLKHFNFFTVNLNEEFSGLFGGVLHRQTEFVAASIKYILSLYPSSSSRPPPDSVLIIAHSMGGVVAQALFTLPNFSSSLVTTIITLSSPLSRPVIMLDQLLLQFYQRIYQVWYRDKVGVARNVTLVSVSGGDSDVQVPFHLTVPPSHSDSTLSISSSAVPRNWVPADHRAIVWCRRLQLALTRALFMLQTPPTNELTSDPNRRNETLHHLLFTGWTVPMTTNNRQLKSDQWKVVEEMPFYKKIASHTTIALSLSSSSSSSSSSLPGSRLLVATDSSTSHWLYVCSTEGSPHSLNDRANCSDLSHSAHLLPPREKVVKYTMLLWTDLMKKMNATHIVVNIVKEKSKGQMKDFVMMEWCGLEKKKKKEEEEEESLNLSLPIWGSTKLHISPPHCTLTKVSLPQLTQIWTSHSAIVTSCPGVKGGLLLPRLPHTPLHHDNGSGHLEIQLSLQFPLRDEGVAELLLWSPSNCSLTVTISPSFLPLAGKFLVLYTPLLLPWVTVVATASSRKRDLLRDIGLLTVMWFLTYLGIPPWTDWEKLTNDGLWTLWTPPLLHLVTHGIFSIFRMLQDIIFLLLSLWFSLLLSLLLSSLLILHSYYFNDTSFYHILFSGHLHRRCFQRRRRTRREKIVMAVVMVMVYVGSMAMCSSASLLCVLAAYTIWPRNYTHTLLCCLFILSVPSLASWLKNIRFSLQLSPDPLFWPVGVASAIALTFLLLPPPQNSPFLKSWCGFTIIPLSPIYPISLLSLLTLLYSTIHTYRLSYLVAAAILLSPRWQQQPHHHSHKND